MVKRVSVLMPARDEEETLPHTLPRLVNSLDRLNHLGQWAEAVVVVQAGSPFLVRPSLRHPMVRIVSTDRIGKFNALRVGTEVADGDIIVPVDADVVVGVDTVEKLVRPLLDGRADVSASRVEFVAGGHGRQAELLASWAAVSADAWDRLRREYPDQRWALPGAMYAIRREYLPTEALCPLVDDASVGLHANEMGAVFAYEPAAVSRTAAPARMKHWVRQKLRSRRGWAALRRLRPVHVGLLEQTIRGLVREGARDVRWARAMQLQDHALRMVATARPGQRALDAGEWKPSREEGAVDLVLDVSANAGPSGRVECVETE
jgi:cellulose synthase/poly-beta-1,6-N-acetylglucosamine synthase-like glycosyltransferase